MNKSITYSLLVPCYNAEAYVATFIEQINNLTIKFDQVIFYDDASTDQTARLITEMGYSLLNGKKNMGPGYARNRLAEAASSKYIHFHDIDDELVPDFLELINNKALANYDVIVGYADWLSSTDRRTLIEWRYDEKNIKQSPVSYFISNPLGIINVVYKKASFVKVKGFDEHKHCWEDADLHVRLAMANCSFSVVNKVLAFSIRHSNGISNNQELCWQCRINYLDSYKQNLNQEQLLALGEAYEKAAYALFYYKKVRQAKMAILKSRLCGFDAPKLNNSFFKIIKLVSPTFAFLLKAKLVLLIEKYKR